MTFQARSGGVVQRGIFAGVSLLAMPLTPASAYAQSTDEAADDASSSMAIDEIDVIARFHDNRT